MKIRPKIIPKFQQGGVPDWYLKRYGYRTALLGWDLNQGYNYADANLMTNDHRNAGNLNTVYRKNLAYIGTPKAVSSDIQTFYNSDGNGMSAEDFVKFYNDKAAEIRSHWAQDLTYNKDTAGKHNKLFRKMFASRSNMSKSPGEAYNIGYQLGRTKSGYDIQDIEGSSTWLRRMDLYENEFDPNNPDSNRLHEITLKDGTKATVFKKANGDIGLLQKPQDPNNFSEEPSLNGGELPEVVVEGTDKRKIASLTENPKLDKESFLDRLGAGLKNVAPDLLDAIRLAGNLHNNARVYDAVLKGIRPNLQLTYNTHRQVVGDEATKLAYYRRAALGQTKAALPFTADADRQMAYLYEAKRIGDELRALGDLADNAEIRRTSDESNQHQWGNTQRATEVANYNTQQINLANASKLLLKAQKYAADWTNLDNYLMGLLNRFEQKKNKQEAIENLIKLLLMEDELTNDPDIIELRQRITKLAKEKGNYENEEVLALSKELQNLARKKRINAIRTYMAKSGMKLKLEQKFNDKYLYRVIRDTVEHFRRMSKMTDDSRIKSKDKPIKLSPHPQGSTRKYLQGGLAPFTIYRPLGVGGESAVSTQVSGSGTSSKGEKDTASKDKLDMLKKLFESVKGLPIDVNMVYNEVNEVLARAKAFGEELSTDDIASMYLNTMQRLSNLKYSQDAFDKAKEQATANEALNEYAVSTDGRLVLQDMETGKILLGTIEDAKSKKLNPITNNQLLNIRALSKGQAFNDDLLNVVNNGVGLNKISAQIKQLAGNIGSQEKKIEGISEIQSNKIKAGLQTLAGFNGTPDGYYKITKDIKDPSSNVRAALTYIYNMLPNNYKTILKLHSGSEENSLKLIASYLTSQVSSYYKEDIAPLTGKASSSTSDSNGNDKSGIKSNFLDLVLRDLIGIDREFSMITKDGNSKLYSLNAKYISQLPNVDTDMSIEEMLGKSKIGSIMDSRLGVTFGDLVIAPENFKDIMFDLGGGATIVTLPCKYENGHKVVNFAIKDEYDNAVNEVSKTIPVDYSNPTFLKALTDKLHEKGLDSLLKGDSIDPNMLGHFMVVSAYTTDKINFNTNSRYIEKVRNPNKLLEERLIKGLSTNKDKNDYEIDIDDKFGWFELGWDDVYRGNIFIPLNNDPISALTGWGSGDNIKLKEAQNLAEQYQNFLKSSKQKDSSSSVL